VLLAWLSGKTIQYRAKGGQWLDEVGNPMSESDCEYALAHQFSSVFEYRVKPEEGNPNAPKAELRLDQKVTLFTDEAGQRMAVLPEEDFNKLVEVWNEWGQAFVPMSKE
jgi:hypothetical protein